MCYIHTENGDLYVWGMNEYGQCGIKKVEEVKKPTLTTELNFKVEFVSCGYYHTALISSTKYIF